MFSVIAKGPIHPRERVGRGVLRVLQALSILGIFGWHYIQGVRSPTAQPTRELAQRTEQSQSEAPARTTGTNDNTFTIWAMLAALGLLAYGINEVREGSKELREMSYEKTVAEPLPLRPDEVERPVIANALLPMPNTPADVMPRSGREK